jgi:hypothetical protein
MVRGTFRIVALLALLAVLALSVIQVTRTPVAQAGTNGQQLVFKKYSGSQATGIKWVRVYGTDQNGQSKSFYKEFNPPVNEYSLSGWWWKGQAYVDFSVTYPTGAGRYNWCYINVPINMSGNWVTVYLDTKLSSPGCST